ncbi:hypothetical protein E4U59_000743 [Claviceps monticola]|nr:hypothetical protein E4U59_000743 [Claviceps monticola]
MDNTYNVNRFNVLLMQVIGVSAVAKNFSVAFGRATREDADAYTWFSQQLRYAKKMPKFALPRSLSRTLKLP